ncbi:Uncharacterized protein FKW44_004414 [Caligus rogercresseyi]|uniref:Uncharacterized protein n=1 Tax=Caligus rogercresseyi TaxID=217165 RepID=A0A7T8KBB0_CALRO|nr:Uncharacterized protein FKW44_004414 [Caligus rogercresseyi]
MGFSWSPLRTQARRFVSARNGSTWRVTKRTTSWVYSAASTKTGNCFLPLNPCPKHQQAPHFLQRHGGGRPQAPLPGWRPTAPRLLPLLVLQVEPGGPSHTHSPGGQRLNLRRAPSQSPFQGRSPQCRPQD